MSGSGLGTSDASIVYELPPISNKRQRYFSVQMPALTIAICDELIVDCAWISIS